MYKDMFVVQQGPYFIFYFVFFFAFNIIISCMHYCSYLTRKTDIVKDIISMHT